ILMSIIIPIGDDETAGELHDRMKEIGAALLLDTVNGLAAGNLTEQSQVTTLKAGTAAFLQPILKHAPKIFTATCQVNWNKPVQEVYNLVRGLSPYPTAFTFLGGRKLKLYQTEKITAAVGDDQLVTTPAGEFKTDQKTFLYFACADGYLSIKELQLEGKKKMAIADFLRGYRWQ
ncbi:MAG: methionyl-tRNA formyltransferase, partial [Aquabacterium sp.]|nr:methionyl-tRNA formyltransferase [Ferruginibacter sp.]